MIKNENETNILHKTFILDEEREERLVLLIYLM